MQAKDWNMYLAPPIGVLKFLWSDIDVQYVHPNKQINKLYMFVGFYHSLLKKTLTMGLKDKRL